MKYDCLFTSRVKYCDVGPLIRKFSLKFAGGKSWKNVGKKKKKIKKVYFLLQEAARGPWTGGQNLVQIITVKNSKNFGVFGKCICKNSPPHQKKFTTVRNILLLQKNQVSPSRSPYGWMSLFIWVVITVKFAVCQKLFMKVFLVSFSLHI